MRKEALVYLSLYISTIINPAHSKLPARNYHHHECLLHFFTDRYVGLYLCIFRINGKHRDVYISLLISPDE